MTRKQYLSALDKLDLSPYGLRTAQALGAAPRTIRGWAAGSRAIPGPVVLLLEMYLHHGVPGRFRPLLKSPA